MIFRFRLGLSVALAMALGIGSRLAAAPPAGDTSTIKQDVIRQVERQFWAGRVEAESAQFELGKGLTVRNLTYYAGNRPDDPPLVRMRAMILVIPFQELIRRTYRAQQVILVDPVMTLDLDTAGNLVFPPPLLPPPVPLSTMTIESGRLVIRRARPPGPPQVLRIEGIAITMAPGPAQPGAVLAQQLSGTIADAGPDLGTIRFSGRFLGRAEPARPGDPVARFVRRQGSLTLAARNSQGGRLTVRAQVPIEAGAGPLDVDARVESFDLARLASALVPDLPPMTGRGTGSIRLQGPAGRPLDPRQLDATGALAFDRLAVRDFAADALRLDLELRRGVLTAGGQGRAAGGQVDLTTEVDFPERGPARQRSHLQGQHLNLSAIDSLLGPESRSEGLPPASGTVDLVLDVAGGLAPDTLSGSGRLQVARLRAPRVPHVSVATANLRLDPGHVRIEDLAVQVAGGSASGEATYDFDHRPNTDLSGELQFEQIDPSRIAPPGNAIFASLRGTARGWLRFRSVHGGDVQGSSGVGEITVQTWAGAALPAAKLQSRVVWSLAPDGKEGFFDLDDFRGDVAGGTLAGEVHFYPNSPSHTEGEVSFQNLNLGTILNSASGAHDEARGRVSGLFTLKGAGASAGQIEAVIHFLIRDADLQHTPIVKAIARATGTPAIQVGNVRTGEGVLLLQGRTAVVKDMTLEGPFNHSLVNGTMTSDGRVDLRLVSRPQALAAVRASIQVTGPQKYPIARVTRIELVPGRR